MRKKKYLGQRLGDCAEYLVDVEFATPDFNVDAGDKYFIDFEKIFGNSNPVMLEIGCGKGRFACEAAKQNPDINFLAVEKTGNVIVVACEAAKKEQIRNVRFVQLSAEYLNRYIRPCSISRIYLNFSCPYPKYSYRNHRLTSGRFLEIYKKILLPGAEIHQKTDNMHFFEFSMEQLSEHGYTLKNISLDLHNSDFEGNIETEYESKFVGMGLPIYRLEAYIK